MRIISHRGYWINSKEKNTKEAFERSLSLGFGIETDIRDLGGKLVISHDPPTGGELTFDDFLKIYKSYSSQEILAINIKSDGLQIAIQKALKKYQVSNYFLFDMSVPDLLGYLSLNLVTFSRLSEVENNPILNDITDGLWLDQFYEDWLNADLLKKLVLKHKMVCLVSPELHGREFHDFLQMVIGLPKNIRSKIAVCTDFPHFYKEAVDGL